MSWGKSSCWCDGSLYQPLMEIYKDLVGDAWGDCQPRFSELLATGETHHLIMPLGREASRETRLKMQLTLLKGYAEELQESDLTLESLEEKLSH